jgi:hypothetical protein
MSSLELHDLKTEKERLEGDRAKLIENLQQAQNTIQQMQSQSQALAGAIQTCDYFINKIESPPDGDEKESSSDDGDKIEKSKK